jgi:hypothetical protein
MNVIRTRKRMKAGDGCKGCTPRHFAQLVACFSWSLQGSQWRRFIPPKRRGSVRATRRYNQQDRIFVIIAVRTSNKTWRRMVAWWMKWKGFGRNRLWPNLRHSSSIPLEGLRNITKNFWELNPGPSEHELGVPVALERDLQCFMMMMTTTTIVVACRAVGMQ